MKKVLILYTSVGLGHKSLAENIAHYLGQAGYEVKLHDTLQLQAGFLVSVGTAVHQFINKRLPFIWGWLYSHSDHGWFARLTLPKRIKTASRNYHQVKEIIDSFQPDLVITTQTTPSAIVAFLKQQRWYKGLFGIAFSDYHLHRYWLYDQADFYLVNIEEQKQEMVRLGIDPACIHVVGTTLLPRLQFHITSDDKNVERTILLASGSLGTGLSEKWIVNLARAVDRLPNARLVIVCGKNQKLAKRLKQGLSGTRTIIHGYYSPMAELYAQSDIFLTKPGGLTTAEAFQWQLPILPIYELPGGEKLNYDYLLQNHLIMPKPNSVEPLSLIPIIKEELASHSFKQSLISNSLVVELVQFGKEGQLLCQAVESMFHKV